MSAYFARLAASHGVATAPSTARAANSARVNADGMGGDSMGGNGAGGDSLPEVNAVVDAAPSPVVFAATAPVPRADTLSGAAAGQTSSGVAMAAAAAPPAIERSTASAPQSGATPRAAAPAPRAPHDSASRTEVREVTHSVTQTVQTAAPASPLPSPRSDSRIAIPRVTPARATNAAPATRASVPATPAMPGAEIPTPAAAVAQPVPVTPDNSVQAGARTVTTSLREHVTRAEARVAPPAPVVVPARATQVHIGRVELVVSAPTPPPPARRPAPAHRAARAPAATRESFSVHRHYLRVP